MHRISITYVVAVALATAGDYPGVSASDMDIETHQKLSLPGEVT